MKNKLQICSAVVAASLMVSASAATAGSKNEYYEVTVTNLTRSQSFTPILVASHKSDLSLFEVGSAASDELALLAEGGDVAPLTAVLEVNGKVASVKNSGGLLAPGATVTIQISAKNANHISLASMLIPTNDAFFALNNARVSNKHTATFYLPAYDAGTEMNDEACVSIPGPVCGGEGYSPNADGEGYVHIHGGIHGIGDLPANVYDWRNPVAKITVRKVGEK